MHLSTEVRFIFTGLLLANLSLLALANFPEFRKIPNQQYFQPSGSNLNLPCITERKDQSCFWLGGGTVIIDNGPSGHYHFNSGNGDCTLTIKNLSLADNQTFECQAPNLKLKSWPKAEVVVLVKPDAPQIIENNIYGEIVADRVTKITCRSNGGNPLPTLDWYLDDEKISQNASSVVKDRSVESTLEYTFRKLNNASTLACKSLHPLGPQNITRSLNVYYKPIVTVDQSIYTVTEGDDLEINCQVDSNPPADPLWKPNSDIESKHYKINGGKLSFRRISAQVDTSSFQCSAKNHIAVSEPASVRMNVLYQPRLIKASDSEKMPKITLGNEFRLNCKFNGNPKPTIRWNFVDAINSKEHLNINSNSENPESLVLKNVSYSNEGEYYCEGVNSNSMKNKDFIVRSNQFRLDVTGSPAFLNDKEIVYGYENTNTRIEHFFCSDPPPTSASWVYSGMPQQNVDVNVKDYKDSSFTDLDDNTARLIAVPLVPIGLRSDHPTCFKAGLLIRNTDKADSQEYLLKVTNSYGTAEGIVYLKVTSKLSGAMLISIFLILLLMLFLFTVLFILFLRRRANKRDDDFEDKSDVRVPINEESDAKRTDEKVL